MCAELPNDVIVYGFAFTDSMSDTDMDELHESLMAKGHLLENVVFSTFDDDKDRCTWIVAANKYLKDDDVRDVVDFIVDNEIEDEYLLIMQG